MAAAALLKQLQQAGLLASAGEGQGNFVFAPAPPGLEDPVTRLSEVHRFRLV
ncbi:MAG TPA: hypothetical protein VIM12_08455 [Noviherbaspirillum sp.]|jgi:hypothetical protein|uniref:hypothetical protein n=1 Tax=Noviherbaspirillum sp. TaxID=1926288 RepID=UPI002F93E0F7